AATGSVCCGSARFIFFFSSRRRHTRLVSDWSSDVCSSDLKVLVLGNALPLYDHPQRVAEELAMLDVLSGGRLITGMVVGLGVERSEERRVGKEGGSRGWAEP